MHFHFVAHDTQDPLACGMMTVNLLHISVPLTEIMPPPPFVELAQRHTPTHNIDWNSSVVAAVDRPLVIKVVDDIYNMYALMPATLTVSLEPINEIDYATHAKCERCKTESRLLCLMSTHLYHYVTLARWSATAYTFASCRRLANRRRLSTATRSVVELRKLVVANEQNVCKHWCEAPV